MRSLTAVALSVLLVTACSPVDAEEGTTTSPLGDAATTAPASAPGTTRAPSPATNPLPTTTTIATPLEVEGVVVAVDGGLQVVDSFTLLVGDGEQMTFDPGPGLLFAGGPLSHLRDHLTDGAPVYVVYTAEPDGSHVAIEVGDAH